MTRTLHIISACIGMCALAAASAQEIADPTRPSTAWAASQSQAAGKEVPPPVSNDPQIVVRRGSDVFVVINGTVVRPGETYNGARLLGVDGTDGIAIWQRGGVREVAGASAAVVKSAVDATPARVPQKKKQANGEIR